MDVFHLLFLLFFLKAYFGVHWFSVLRDHGALVAVQRDACLMERFLRMSQLIV